MNALFTALDTSPLMANVATILIALISVGLLFVGNRYIRHALRDDGGSFDLDYDKDQFERWEATQGPHYDEEGTFHKSGWYGRG